MSRPTNPYTVPSYLPRHKTGLVNDVLSLFTFYGELSYYDLWFLTGATAKQSRRAVKYLRTQGYVFATSRHSNGYGAGCMSMIFYLGYKP